MYTILLKRRSGSGVIAIDVPRLPIVGGIVDGPEGVPFEILQIDGVEDGGRVVIVEPFVF